MDKDQFREIISQYSPEEQELIFKALDMAESKHKFQVRESGEPYIIHPMEVARILVSMRMDAQTVMAALLHDLLEDTNATRNEIRSAFGREVENLVNGLTKISLVRAKNKSVQEAETIRKMLIAMVKDIRVILIKLADKLHNMRTLYHKNSEERQKAIATECLDIYAPLAGRLGISWLKDELEDLSLKHLNPNVFEQIKRFVSTKREERSSYLGKIENDILEAAAREGIEILVETRAKHFYSIYQKMRRRNKPLEEIYDILGIRILCTTESECYTLMGLVHRLWIPLEGRIKDYIAIPKANKYQSLHTTVMAYGGKLIEIQIRTKKMHQTAEYGVAAHWLYKREISGKRVGPQDIAFIDRIKNLSSFRFTSQEFLDELKRELLKDSIYVFTPKGDVIQLPFGSTPIDFAYHIHTEVGHHCLGAKADGAIISLKEELKNTQVIEILTASNAHPHLNWLRYSRTASARSKIRNWLNKHDDSLFIERSIVARKSADSEPKVKKKTPRKGKTTLAPKLGKIGIRIGNERNMMIRIARCCQPAVGDRIVGYISRGRGIIVHRKDCRNLEYIADYPERTIDVEWETVSPRSTKRFRVSSRKTSDLFSEIEGAIRKYKGHLIEGKIEDAGNSKMEAFFIMEIENTADFRKILKSIRHVPSVLNIQELSPETAEN
ncbi:MAG: RelA/SpoT family protein [Spirochaetia bacterium]